MNRAAARPNYLGGIGLMLEVAHVCPRCGKRLADTPSASAAHFLGNGCRPTVYAALPEPETPREEDDDVPLLPASRKIHDFEDPASYAPRADRLGEPAGGSLPGPARSRALVMPWLRPPDLGEVL
jgi:hypothetical protein